MTAQTTAKPMEPGLKGLAAQLAGELVRPGDPGWDEARRAWALAVDQRPAAVVLAENQHDVAATVRTAARLGLRVAPQGTGHNAAPLGDLSGTILLKTERLRDVRIDPDTMVARVGAGALWGEVSAAAAKHGLAALAGSAADVGVVGYTLGGGIGWLARSHGLAANSVTAVDIVTADGRLRRADEAHEADLFWAVRGGGGDYGVVTALEFRLYPVPEVQAGALFWPAERAREVLQAWREAAAGFPASTTSVGRVLHFPPLPDLPPELAGNSFVVVEAVLQEPEDRAAQLLGGLRALGPVMDSVRATPVEELSALHMDPPGPVPGIGGGTLVTELSAGMIDAFVDAATGPGSGALLSAELRHLGGALEPGFSDGGAVSGLAGEALCFGVGVAPFPEAAEAVRAALARLLAALEPWQGGSTPNFAESRTPAERLYGDATERLRRIKADVDPDGTIVANHPVG